MTRWALAAVAGLCACGAGEMPTFVDLAGLGRDLVLLGAFDEKDRLERIVLVDITDSERVAGLFSVAMGGHTRGVAFDRSALLARVPRLDIAKIRDLGFEPRTDFPGECPEGVLVAAEERVRVPWPEGAIAFELEAPNLQPAPRSLDEGWFVETLMTAPVDPSRCQGRADFQVRAFAPDMPLLKEGTLINGVSLEFSYGMDMNEFVRIDEERMLVAQGRFLFLAERGVGLVDLPNRFIETPVGWWFNSVAAGPPDPGTGRRRIFASQVASEPAPGAPTTGSRLVEASLDQWDLSLVTMRPETTDLIDAVYIDRRSRRLVVYQAPMTILQETREGGPLEVVATFTDTQLETDKRGFFRETGVAEEPLALLTAHRGSLYLGKLDRPAWRNFNEALPITLSHRAFTTRVMPSGVREYLIGNTAGQMFQRRDDEVFWRRRDARFDPRLSELSCAADPELTDCGFARVKHAWQTFTSIVDTNGTPATLAFSDLCSVAFIIDSDGCGSFTTLDALGRPGRDAKDEILSGRSEGGFLTLGTELGNFYEIPWSELGLER